MLASSTSYGMIPKPPKVEYFQFPITTSINIKYNKEMRFPSVTLCNQNRIKESLILDNNATRFKDLADIGRLFEGCKGHG